jgi:protein-tyrosine phosphatase
MQEAVSKTVNLLDEAAVVVGIVIFTCRASQRGVMPCDEHCRHHRFPNLALLISPHGGEWLPRWKREDIQVLNNLIDSEPHSRILVIPIH